MAVVEHEHPLCLVDLQPEYPHCEDEYDDNDDLIPTQDFQSRCDRCKQDITWFHRYYYKCTRSCEYSLHKFCGELPLTLAHKTHPTHPLVLFQQIHRKWSCNSCKNTRKAGELSYCCSKCNFYIDVNCAMSSVENRIIYHPSHNHSLVAILEPLLCKCKACDKKHEGIFYICSTCFNFFIHSDCAFLPKTLLIQKSTDDAFSHTHPLVLSYSFPRVDQKAKKYPLCRVCRQGFTDYENLWIYKCEKCRYYAHLECATSREEPFMSIFKNPGTQKTFKNFQDSDYPDLLHLPFPDITSNIQKHLFFKGDSKLGHNYHEHPLTLVLSGCDDTTHPSTSRTDVLLCHDPMKRIELLCNACVKPITSEPFYKCANENEHCKFVIHTWCTQLPAEIKNHPGHPQHTLTLHPCAVGSFFSMFSCSVCGFLCNGFVYSCSQCEYHIDVTCSFIPENITHEVHPGHILSRFEVPDNRTHDCRLCLWWHEGSKFMFRCFSCDVNVHVKCALLLPREIQHKLDKHPMSLSYFPVENHKSEYFCEVCEEEFDPERCFYHCQQCDWSIHSACAPSILQSETATGSYYNTNVFAFSNVKFGGILNAKFHKHPLSFVQGTANDGPCDICGSSLQYEAIFKCLQCKYAVDWDCCEELSS